MLLDVCQHPIVKSLYNLGASFYFKRVRPGINDFVVIVRLGHRRLDLVRFVRVDEANNEVLHARFFGRNRSGYGQQLFDRRREMRHVVFDLVKTVFDALGDLDLALARQ